MKSLFASLLLTTSLAVTSVPCVAADAAEAGRALVKHYADAIVGVELVVMIKYKMGDREAPPRESKVEINGTTISSSGLVVTSLAEVDPQSAFQAMGSSSFGGGRLELVGAEFKEVKLRLADGTELPAKFVLKDADLDLAFMAPDTSAADAKLREFPYVKLETAAQGELLGSYFNLSRAPKVLQRVPMVRSSQIMGVVEKPRRVYLMTDPTLGTPTFDLEGRVLGISLQHFANGRRTGLVVIPADDIVEMAKQAAAVQAK